MPWTDISQAAFTLGVSERTIRNWIKNGKMNSRSINGRREVEIPDPEDGPAAHAFADDMEDETKSGFDPQKRLEVALIECGRVKGTLASQERVMENLSANIQELNAKLQKANDHIWKRTLLAVGAAFLGILAWVITEKAAEADRNVLSSQYVDARDAQDKRYNDSKEQLLNKQQARMEAKRAEHNATINLLRKTALREKETALAALESKLKKESSAFLQQTVDRYTATEKALRADLDAERGARIRTETELKQFKEKLADTQKELHDLKDELKKKE